MKVFLQRIRAAWSNLAPREQMLVGAVGVLLGAAILWLGVVTPLVNARERARQRVADAEQQIQVMQRLRAEYDEINGRLSEVEERIRSGPTGNMLTTLDTLARKVDVAPESMEPQASPANDLYRETKLEVELKQVSLPQAVRYLHEIESTEQVMSVKTLRIKTRPDDSGLLDVRFTVSSFEPI